MRIDSGHAERTRLSYYAVAGHPLLRGPGSQLGLCCPASLAFGRCLPALQRDAGFVSPLATYLEVPGMPQAVLRESRNDLRGQPARSRQVASGAVAARQRKERYQLLRTAPGAWRDAKEDRKSTRLNSS